MTNLDRVKQMTEDAFGEWAEKDLKKALEAKGWSVTMKKDSRGASDLIATKGFLLDEKWYIQVKATRKDAPAIVSNEDRDRVIDSARSNGTVPVLGLIWFEDEQGSHAFRHAATGKVLAY